MSKDTAHKSYRPLRTPGAAAIAGIIFAVLQITAYVLLQLAIPPGNLETGSWLSALNYRSQKYKDGLTLEI